MMDDLEQPRCSHCGTVMRDDPEGFRCGGCGLLLDLTDERQLVVMPPEFKGPAIGGG